MYHTQQQVALTPLRGQHSTNYKEFLKEAVYTAPGQRTISQTPREGFQKEVGISSEEQLDLLESLRSENATLRKKLALAQDQSRVKQTKMLEKLKESLKVSDIEVGGGHRRTRDMPRYEVENRLLKRQMENMLKDAAIKENSIASLESYSRILEAQNIRLLSRTNSLSPRMPSNEGKMKLSEDKETDSNCESTTTRGPGVSRKNFKETSEKLENKLNIVLESVKNLTRRVATFQSNPPFDTTSAGGAALQKMNTSVDQMGAATDEVERVASKLSMLENTIARLAGTNVLSTVVANSKQASTSIYQISDALQNMEGKFDLLVKNLVHKVENIAGLISEQHQPVEGFEEHVEAKVLDTTEVMRDITEFKGELERLCAGLSKIDGKLEHSLSREPMGLQLERCRGESYTSLLTSDVADLRKDLNALRGEITRTTVTPISTACESLLDRIAAISTYMVELKLQAFERSRGLLMQGSASDEGQTRTAEMDNVITNGNSHDRCRTM